MLDDTDRIKELDRQDALGVIGDQPKQLLHEYAQPDLSGYRDIDEIVVAGMGGSALEAEFVSAWLGSRLPVPIIIVRDYSLPAFVDERTLVVGSSYSGNTEETISALADAERRGARIVVNSAGGKLLELAREKGYPSFEVPGGYQPRLAVLLRVRALAQLIEGLGLLSGIVDELEEAARWADGQTASWMLDSPVAENEAKQITQALEGRLPIVYAGPVLRPLAMKWKIGFNENGKQPASWNVFPELNHNEFIGWSEAWGSEATQILLLRSDLDHPQVKKRMDVSPELLEGRIAEPITVHAQGETLLQQLLYILVLGDFASAYMAFLKGIDPTPVDLIEELKGRLA